MIHWKVIAGIGARDTANPILVAWEFDSQRAAEAASAWVHQRLGYDTTVIKDDENDDDDGEDEAEEAAPALEPVPA